VNTTHLLETLRVVVGSDHTQSGSSIEPSLPVSWNVAATVAPASEEEVVGIVRAIEETGAILLPCGGCSQIRTGYPPATDRPVVLLSTSRLNRILDHQPDDMTVTCQPGVTLAALQEKLAEQHQFLPLDVPLPNVATLGGIVSTNANGFWRPVYGATRDLLIGVRAVLTGGEAVKGGGKVVKNVAGYDVCKLFTGAWGTLGVLTELTFKIRPLPETQNALAFPAPDVATAARVGLSLHHARLAPAFLLATNELGSLPQGSGDKVSDTRHPTPDTLLLGLHGTPSRVEWQAAEFTRLASEAGLTTAPFPVSDTELAALRDRQARLDAALALRIACLPTEVSALAQRLEVLPSVSLTAHCMTGLLSLTADPAVVAPATLRAVLPADANLIWTRLDENTPGREEIAIWGETRGEFFLHRALKQAVDPKNTFSPGRFFGRL
jgi:glycolate oxidase FAD binding subunit